MMQLQHRQLLNITTGILNNLVVIFINFTAQFEFSSMQCYVFVTFVLTLLQLYWHDSYCSCCKMHRAKVGIGCVNLLLYIWYAYSERRKKFRCELLQGI